jgi:hypothetical protein
MRDLMKVAVLILVASVVGCGGNVIEGTGGTGGTGGAGGTGGSASASPCPETSCEPNTTQGGAFTGTTDCGCGFWHCFCGSDAQWHACCCPEGFTEDPECSEE